ncbi:hypothetical protein IQ255_07830 [Pleurocapsales cyanobacterium LEGE 10410]|nr:hypothetical protein [Pleurocapsales cyanobacterium LEGE 10410]
MKTNILDDYNPDISSEEPRVYVSLDPEYKSLAVRNNIYKVILTKAIKLPSSRVLDLLNLAISVYTADLKIPRRFSEDRWTRTIVLHVPVINLTTWQKTTSSIIEMLGFLTGDRWEISFRKNNFKPKLTINNKVEKVSKVSLFSGGLDSLVGAIDLLEEGKRIALVGHYGAGVTNKVQETVLGELEKLYPDLIESYLFYLQPPKSNSEGQGEPSMRSRSFLFFSLAVVVASLFTGKTPISVAENGLISLNVPLTNPRIGSLSTRTTHPYFVSLFSDFLSLLKINNLIILPYRFQTKGEMIAQTKNQDALKKTVDLSMSCSHPEAGRYQGKKPNLHCGYCVPCIIRRASLASAQLDKPSTYAIDILQDPPDPTTETGRDLRAFEMAIERGRFYNYRQALFDVLATGTISSDDIEDYIDVYMRGMKEVESFLS